MKRLTLVIVMLVCFVGIASAEIRLKAGGQYVGCKAVNPSIVVEGGYQCRYKSVALEGDIGALTSNIKEVGQLWALEPSIMGKVYLGDFYVGAGVGYYFNYLKNTDCDDQTVQFGVIGLESGNWFIEGKVNISDLDIETGLNKETQIEKNSRFDGVQVMIGRKF